MTAVRQTTLLYFFLNYGGESPLIIRLQCVILKIKFTKEGVNMKQKFNATRMALAAAVGEYIDEPDMTIDEVMCELSHAGRRESNLTLLENVQGSRSGFKLLKEIDQTAQGLRGLMEIAYNAAKLNQELI